MSNAVFTSKGDDLYTGEIARQLHDVSLELQEMNRTLSKMFYLMSALTPKLSLKVNVSKTDDKL